MIVDEITKVRDVRVLLGRLLQQGQAAIETYVAFGILTIAQEGTAQADVQFSQDGAIERSAGVMGVQFFHEGRSLVGNVLRILAPCPRKAGYCPARVE